MAKLLFLFTAVGMILLVLFIAFGQLIGPAGVTSSAPTFIMVIGHRSSFTQAKVTLFKKSDFGRTYVYNDY